MPSWGGGGQVPFPLSLNLGPQLVAWENPLSWLYSSQFPGPPPLRCRS